MSKNYYFQDDGSFIIENYHHTSPISNFLPGIAGIWGIPIWAFYVNRAQGLISFGIEDKDHTIMEFFPATSAYNFTPFLGFRTFLKINKKIHYEPYRFPYENNLKQVMIMRSSCLEIKEEAFALGLSFAVKYFTLPNSPLGGLVRALSIKNISGEPMSLEIIDGLPRIIPFGSKNVFLKDLTRTLEAWMHSFACRNLATFKLIVDPKDTVQTKYIEGANFNYSFYEEEGRTVYPCLIVEPTAIFAQDTSFLYPVRFYQNDFRVPLTLGNYGKLSCAFSYFKWNLAPQKEQIFYSIFGSSFKEELIGKFTHQLTAAFLKQKEKENESIIEEIKDSALCVSNLKEFNHYLKHTYLDNVLRGGYPCSGKSAYYIFSRKHGDLERDYNKFKLLPFYFSEGEGNYRDVNQNRRIDLFFNPSLERKNIVYFASLIRIDGYNPLLVRGERLFFRKKDASSILKEFNLEHSGILSLLLKGFYLGEFFNFLEIKGIIIKEREQLAERLREKGLREPHACFGAGFWIDHWHYNLDLIENFLYFYPERIKDLFLSRDYSFFDDEFRVKPRAFRYKLKNGKVYQEESIEEVSEKQKLIEKRGRFKNALRTKKGEIVKINLVVKLLSLILNKAATVDATGVGIEMETDRPGWCDSLNGLPFLFGSSLSETLELKRACLVVLCALEQFKKDGIDKFAIPQEIFSFFIHLDKLLTDYLSGSLGNRDYLWWDKANSLKENFRKETFFYLQGKEENLKLEKLENFLNNLLVKLDKSIGKAQDRKSGLYFSYFTHEVKKYKLKRQDKTILPLSFERKPLPLFLEAIVHFLRVVKDRKSKKNIYRSVKNSTLFDRILRMYRLNESLKNEPLEIGRSRVFIPGWLENESIWLHMEYKYLLEVLKSGLYEEFFEDFYNCGVCFLKPEDYGRSILENSSFIVSSAYPDKSLWKRGFVPRLSGSTVELLNIWLLLCLGEKPFFVDEEDKLCLRFSPILKAEFFTDEEETINFKGKEVVLEKNCFAFKLFSSTLVVYHNPQRRDTFPNCRVKMIVVEEQKEKHIVNSPLIEFPLSYRIREAKIDRIDVYLE